MTPSLVHNNFTVHRGTVHSDLGCRFRGSLSRKTWAHPNRRWGGGPKNRGEDQFMCPLEVLQAYLDRVGKAVLAERFDLYRDAVQLPLSILTSSASLTVSTEESLLDGFDDYTDMLQSHGVTEMVRTVKVAQFQGNDHIVGIYETKLMNGAKQVLPTFHSKMWIGCYDGVWKCIKIHNTTNEARWPLLLTRLPPDNWLSEET